MRRAKVSPIMKIARDFVVKTTPRVPEDFYEPTSAFLLRTGRSRPASVGDRVVHKRSLADGDVAEDEIVSIGAEQVQLTGGTVDVDDFADDWTHFDGTPLSL